MYNWILISVISNAVLGTAAVFDKLLLRRTFSDPWVYTFWVAISGLILVFLIPFGFTIIPLADIFFSLLTGILWFAALLFFFWAMSKGEASTVLPIIGALAPLATLLFSGLFLGTYLGIGEFIGFVFLVGGGLVFLGLETKGLRLLIFLLSLASSIFFGISNVFLKIIFVKSSVINGLIWTRAGAILAAAILLVFADLRKRISASLESSETKRWVPYMLNRGWSAVGNLLGSFALLLAHPALVDASNSFKYVVIGFFSWFVLKENFKGRILFKKILGTVLIVGGLLWLGLVNYANSIPVNKDRPINWGVTFSSKFSKRLGLDWQKNFQAVLNDLRPAKIRLVAYWDEIEKQKGIYDFSELDWQVDEAEKAGTPVVLALGMRMPRWPECHVPEWAKNSEFIIQNSALTNYITKVIERYKNSSAVEMWQVENEPFLKFGYCPNREKGFLDKEIALVKSIDPSRPILVTDSGEFGLWYKAAKYGDVFGTTMYRKVYPPSVGKFTGIIEYPLPPSFFLLKEKITRFLTGDYDKKFIVVELQGEPWGRVEIPLLSYEEQISIFPLDYFRDTVEYARQTGFDEYYLWGAEWWYFVMDKHGNSEYWEEVKGLMRQ